jgi:hypothetical protein
MANFLEGGPKNFLFRELPKNILIGTASDPYAGRSGKMLRNAGRMGPSVKNKYIWIISKLVEGQRAGIFKIPSDSRVPEGKSPCLQS